MVLTNYDKRYDAANAIYQGLMAPRVDSGAGISAGSRAVESSIVFTFVAYPDKTKKNEKLSKLFTNILKEEVNVYSIKDGKTAYIQCKGAQPKGIDMLCAFLTPLLIPAYFTGENALTDFERECLDQTYTEDDVKNAIEKLTNRPELRAKIIDRMLEKFDAAGLNAELRRLETSICECKQLAKDGLYQYQQAMFDLNKWQIEYNAVKTGQKPINTHELRDMFQSSKNLDLQYANENEMKFIIRSRIVNFDAAYWNRKDHDSVVTKVLNYTFCDKPLFEINTIACIKICPPSFRGDEEVYGYNEVTHPHIGRYNCWGTAGQAMTDAVLNCDFVQAVNIAIASVSSINLLDATVVSRLIIDIENHRGQIFYCTETRTNMTLKEALKYLEEKERCIDDLLSDGRNA